MFEKIRAIKNLFSGKFNVTHGSSEVELQKTNFGFIYCETALMERVVARAAKKVKGVGDVKVVIDKPAGNYPLKVQFTLVITQICPANEISESLIDETKRTLDYTCGIKNVTVDVKITGVEKVEQKRRVR